MRYLLSILLVLSATCTADEPAANGPAAPADLTAAAATTVTSAEPAASSAATTATSAVPAAPIPPGAPITNITAADSKQAVDGKAAAQFTTDAKWETAGYNNDEIVYTILVTSHDSRIIRCTTSLQGSYYENGQKQTVSDKQLSTVFPDQQVQVGNWMGMDQQSGATYSVHCHAI